MNVFRRVPSFFILIVILLLCLVQNGNSANRNDKRRRNTRRFKEAFAKGLIGPPQPLILNPFFPRDRRFGPLG